LAVFKRRGPMPLNLLTLIENAIGKRYTILAWGAVVALSFSNLAGYATAQYFSAFLITKDGDQILLRNYGDVYLFKSFDKSKNTIGNEIKIVGIGEVEKLKLNHVTLKKPIIAEDETIPPQKGP
jgi:hypothetical protein